MHSIGALCMAKKSSGSSDAWSIVLSFPSVIQKQYCTLLVRTRTQIHTSIRAGLVLIFHACGFLRVCENLFMYIDTSYSSKNSEALRDQAMHRCAGVYYRAYVIYEYIFFSIF